MNERLGKKKNEVKPSLGVAVQFQNKDGKMPSVIAACSCLARVKVRVRRFGSKPVKWGAQNPNLARGGSGGKKVPTAFDFAGEGRGESSRVP